MKARAYETSSAQKRLYMINHLLGDSILYNETRVWIIKGKLDPPRLENAVKQISNRHESLRTCFVMKDGKVLQKVYDHIEVDFNYLNPPTGTAGPYPGNIEKFIDDFFQPYDLGNVPLWKIELVQLQENQQLLLLDFHHIICDGTSMEVIINELASLYLGKQLPEPGIQYVDFTAWQNDLFQDDMIEEQEAYWLEMFAGEIPVLDLPTDYPRSTEADISGASVEFKIDDALTARLKQLAVQHKTSLYVVLLAAFNVLLSRYANQEDIVVGTPISGRTHREFKNMVGMFVNTLALRNRPIRDKTFKEFLTEVSQNVFAAFENQDYQFEMLVEKLAPERQINRNPLFDVMLALQNYPANILVPGQDNHENLEFIPFRNKSKASKFDLTLLAFEVNHHTLFKLEYRASLFHPHTIERLTGHFINIFHEVTGNGDLRISAIRMIPVAEQRHLLDKLNDTAAEYPHHKTIHELFTRQVEKTPDHVALLEQIPNKEAPRGQILNAFGEMHLSYRELNQTSHQLAYLLQERGVKPDIIVGIMVERSADMVIGIMGILKAGGAYLPIDPGYPEERINYMLADSGAKILLTRQDIAGLFSPQAFNNRPKGTSIQPSTLLPFYPSNPSCLAYVIYTSGTTGKPKGIMVHHRGLVNYIKWAEKFYLEEERYNFPLYSSLSFDLTVTSIYVPLISGNTIVIYNDDINDSEFVITKIIRDRKTQIIKLTPAHLKMIKTIGMDMKRTVVKKLIVGGEELTTGLAGEIYRLFNKDISIYNEYGPTETVVGCMIYKYNHGRDRGKTVPIGIPVNNVKIYLLDRDQKPVPIGVVGELSIAGDGLARGYLNRPELTAEKFIRAVRCPMTNDRLYRTGDLGRWLPDGNIEFGGRIDQQLKIRGFRVEVEEIEKRLLSHQSVKEAVVLACMDEEGDKYLAAYVVVEGEPGDAELRGYLSQQLPNYMIPSYFTRLERIPLTKNGKTDRGALPVPGGRGSAKYTAPRGMVEEKLAMIWVRLLGQPGEKISIDDDFFQLGGHSLRAALLTAKIHKEFNVKISLGDIFRNPTIRGLAQCLRETGGEKYIAVKKTEEKEYYPLSSAQKRLFILNQLEPGVTAYNIQMVMRLRGTVHRQKLENAFKQLIQRHESLRTSFHMIDGEPVQRVHKKAAFQIKYHDRELRAKSCIDSFICPFDLSKAPLMRVGLIPLHTPTFGHPSQEGNVEDKHILMVDMHHIITDGLSMGILVRDFSVLYAGESLSHLRVQYKDYVLWQSRGSQREYLQKQEIFWLKQFEDEIPVLDLPLDFPRAEAQSYEGALLEFHLGEQEAAALKKLALRQGATLFMMLLALYQVFLCKITCREDIIVGTDAAGRGHPDLEPMTGMFVNALAMRSYPQSHLDFITFLKQIRVNAEAAFENQEYPFEELVDKVVTHRDPSRNPLFDVLFAFNNTAGILGDTPRVENLGLKLEPYPYELNTTIFDLILNSVENEQSKGIDFSFNYCTRLFKKETIHRFINYFQQVITAVIRDPRVKLSDIGIITAKEKQRILFEFNDTGKDFPFDKNYSRLYEEQAVKTPDKTAVCHGASAVTYLELSAQSNGIAHILLQHGVKPGTIAALYLQRGLDTVPVILGIFKAGAAYLPIEMEIPPERVRYMLEDSAAPVIISEIHHQEQIRQIKLSTGFLPQVLFPADRKDTNRSLTRNPGTDPGNHPGPLDLAYMIYTSGTTGRPRGVMIHQQGMINHLYAKINDLDITGDDRVVQTASIGFDISVWQFLAALLRGGTTLVIDKETVMQPHTFLTVLRKERVTIWESVPSLITAFLEMAEREPLHQLSHLRWMIPTGEALSPALVRHWYKLYPGIQLVNAYGPTEASDDISHYIVRGIPPEAETTVPIGKTVQNMHIYILDKNRLLCPPGIRGEICVTGIGLGIGYLNNPEGTVEHFIDIPKGIKKDKNVKKKRVSLYKTGDIGYFKEDGTIVCLGRLDHQVKIRGNRIELGEIENRLSGHPDVKEAVVVIKQSQSSDKYLCAYVVSGHEPLDSDLSLPAQLKDYLSGLLPGYMVPSHIICLEKMPLTPNGKIDRRALPGAGDLEITGRSEPPATVLEEKVAVIWSDVLGIDPGVIGRDSDFFLLGGHSLRAISVINAVHKVLGVKLPLQTLFRYSTLAGTTAAIRGQEITPFKEIRPIARQEYYELSYAQKRLWILQKRNADSQAFNMPEKVIIHEKVEENILMKILEKLLARHESLRTCFKEIDGKIVQVIMPQTAVEADITLIDLGHLTGEQLQARRIELVEEESHIPFNLEQAPLLRVKLVKCSEEEFDLIFTMHHLVSDGWSMDVLRSQFELGYRAFKQGIHYDPGPVPIQYKDFAHWHNRLLKDREKINRALEVWKKHLQEVPLLELPYDIPYPPHLTDKKSAGYRAVVDAETMEKMKNMGNKYHASLFMVLLAGFNLLMSRVLEQEDIFIGMPGAARQHEDLKNTIGFFVNTLVLKTHVNMEETFVDFLERIRVNTLEILEYQDYPLELICEKLKVKYPGISLFFNMDNTGDIGGEELPPLETGHIKNVQDAKFDMVFYLAEYENGIDITCHYFSQLFFPGTIEKIIEKYIGLLKSTADDPKKPLSVYTASKKKRLLRINQ